MSRNADALNDVLVKLFNRILSIEERVINQAYSGRLTMTEMHVLEAAGIEEPKSMSEIASVLGVTLGTLTASVDRLVQKGYAVRTRPSEDRRIVLLQPTEAGRQAYAYHERFHEEMVKAMLSGLNDDEQLAVNEAARKLYEFFIKVEPEDLANSARVNDQV